MRKRMIVWYSLLAAGVIFHITLGHKMIRRDAIAAEMAAAQEAEKKHDLPGAEKAYQKALSLLDLQHPDVALRAQLTLAFEKTRVPRGGLINAMDHLSQMLDNTRDRAALPPAVELDIRNELAKLHYQAAWLLRLQEAPPRLWMRQADLARQEFASTVYASADPLRQGQAIYNTQAAIWLMQTDALRQSLPDSADVQNGNQQLAQQMAQKDAQQSRSQSGGKPSGMEGQEPSIGPAGGRGGRNTTGS